MCAHYLSFFKLIFPAWTATEYISRSGNGAHSFKIVTVCSSDERCTFKEYSRIGSDGVTVLLERQAESKSERRSENANNANVFERLEDREIQPDNDARKDTSQMQAN